MKGIWEEFNILAYFCCFTFILLFHFDPKRTLGATQLCCFGGWKLSWNGLRWSAILDMFVIHSFIKSIKKLGFVPPNNKRVYKVTRLGVRQRKASMPGRLEHARTRRQSLAANCRESLELRVQIYRASTGNSPLWKKSKRSVRHSLAGIGPETLVR